MQNQYFKTIFRSFYSATVYRHALDNWRGAGLRYFFIVNILVAAVMSAFWALTISQVKPEYLADMVMGLVVTQPKLTFEENINRSFNILYQVPPLHIEGGKLVTENAQPYFIVDPISGRDIAIIDTTGKNTDLADSDASVLVTDTKILTRDKQAEKDQKGTPVAIEKLIQRFNMDEEAVNDTLLIIKQIPPFSLKGGKIITADNKTTKIYSKGGKELVQFGPDAYLDETKLEPLIAISEKEISFRTSLKDEPTYIKSSEITEQNMFEWIKGFFSKVKSAMLLAMPFLIFPFLAIASFVVSAAILVFYTLLGYALLGVLKKDQLGYSQVMRVAAVAITPVLIMRALLPQITQNQDIIYFLFAIGYLYYAIKSVTVRKV